MMHTEILGNKLHALFEEQLSAHECFGGAVAVTQNGAFRFFETFGGARFSKNGLYRLASVTKLFTAAAVLRLEEKELLDTQAPVSRYIPQFSRMTIGEITQDGKIYARAMPSREITLFDLLTHTAGLGADTLGNREYALIPPEIKTSLQAVTDYYAENFHLAFEPGTKTAYSGFAGYDILARISEIVTHTSFGTLLRKLFFDPLGMQDTTFSPSKEQWNRLTPVHKRISGQDISVDFRHTLFRGFPLTYEAGGAALASSAADMAVFLSMLACKGIYNGVRVLEEASVDRMLSPKLPRGLSGLARGENRGFGCIVHDGAGRLPRGVAVCHGAYGTHALILTDQKAAGILLKNSYTDMGENPRAALLFEDALLSACDLRTPHAEA